MEEPVDSGAFSADDIVRDRVLGPDDPDALRHGPIADLVAELVASGATPLNVALYGAWGSGKSSFFSLLKSALDARKKSIAIVRYDAWKYSGQALQRNFISEAADQLAIGSRQFKEGLYEAREEEALDLAGFEWRQAKDIFVWAAKWLAPIILLGVAIYVAAIGLVSAFSDVRFAKELARIPATFLAPSIIAAALVAGGRLLLAESRSTVQRAPPEEEQLEGAFKALLKAAAKKRKLLLGQRKYDRFVFFIDELDRCEAEEVVETLSAVKHFLDQPNCVFIVAADRDVLEKALTELPQSNPTNEESPYYSSASEFLDKVFHTQLSLPPLREQRLTRFARDLVLEKSRGLWYELASTDRKRLDEVIYALIPPHVRSPRRAKILLTSFALNARIADARDIDWRSRAPEIAKLTVFQTEFPLFADDLHLEPRLPELLLEEEPGELSPRAERLLARHRVPASPRAIRSTTGESEEPATEEGAVEEEEGERGLEETARLLTLEKRGVLIHSQREQLRRYLETRRAIQNPRADLLYLEGIGAAVDLDDAALAELIETSARDEPERVVSGLEGLDAQELRKAARVLALMVSQEFGIEQENVMSILMHVVTQLDDDLGEVTDEVLGSLRRFVDDGQTMPDEHLLSALIVATLAEQGADRSFTSDLFDDDRLLADSDRVKEVAFRLPRLMEEHQKLVHARVAQVFVEDEGVLYEPLSSLPEDDAVALLDAAFIGGVQTEIRRLEESGDQAAAGEVAENLFEAIEDRDEAAPTLLRRAEWLLLSLGSAASYAPVRERAERILGFSENEGYRNSHGLEGIRRGSPADWSFWAGMLSREGAVSDRTTTQAVAAVRSIIPRVAEAAGDDQQGASAVVRRVIQAVKLRSSEDSPLSEITEDLQGALAQRQWWGSPDLRGVQENLHRIGHELFRAGEPLKADVSRILLEDLDRAFAFGPSPDAIDGAVTMGAALDVPALRQLAERLVNAAGSYPTAAVRARLQLAHAATRASEKPTEESALYVSREEVQMAASEDDSVIQLWLDLKPRLSESKSLASEVRDDAPAATIGAFATYAKTLTPAQRSELILALVDEDVDASDWIDQLARHKVDEQAVVDPLVHGALQASRAEQRAAYIKNLVALRPREKASARRVAELIIGLLEKRQSADFDNALAALPALGPDHRSKDKLQSAFRTACEELDRKIPARWADEFERARLDLPRKYFKESRSGKIRRFLGRR